MKIQRTEDYKRIFNLPGRDWPNYSKASAKKYNDLLRREHGEYFLSPTQGQALAEIEEVGGGFFPIGVGQGKSFISVLAPVVLKAKNPVLVVPAALRAQTTEQVIPLINKHFKTRPLTVQTHSDFSNKDKAEKIFEAGHDVWVFDECHNLKDRRSGRTKRLLQHFAKNPDCKIVALSGTIANRSLMDFWHLLIWCLRYNAPIPLKREEAELWAAAIDIPKDPTIIKPDASVLVQDYNTWHPAEAYRKRLEITPGVIITNDSQGCDASIMINQVKPEIPESLKDLTKRVAKDWEDPQGDIITEAVELWRICRYLGLGFYYKWAEPGPKDWLKARRAYNAFVRDRLRYQWQKYQTPGDVYEDNKHLEVVQEWDTIKDTFKPRTVTHWLSDEVLKICRDWLDRNKGICWVESIAFGDRLADLSNYPFYGADDLSHSQVLKAKGPIICSMAHATGKNFQDRYNKNLVTSSPTTGKLWEQLIGRTHRQGQKEDEIIIDLLLPNRWHLKSFEQARRDAKWTQQVTGIKQKLNLAALNRY